MTALKHDTAPYSRPQGGTCRRMYRGGVIQDSRVRCSCRASSAASAGRIAGANDSGTARSGSFSPLPVSTHTARIAGATRLLRTAILSAAIPAAEAGSQNTPSSSATLWYDSRISSSVTALNSPPDDVTAFTADFQLA